MNTSQLLLPLRRIHEYSALYLGFTLLGIASLACAGLAHVLMHLLSERRGAQIGRRLINSGFHLYLNILRLMGAARFDLHELDTLRTTGPLILAANHPGLLDAPMVLSRLPNVVCVFKASLIDNPLWGATARLAGYIRNDRFIGSIQLAIDELNRGSQLLLFPEGSRTTSALLDPFRAGPAYVSHRSGVPIQTLFIEQDTRFLGKNLPLFKRPDMPMHFHIRLGQRFDPPADPRQFTEVLHNYFLHELQPSS